MESVYRALVENQYGFHVLVGKQKNKQQTEPLLSDMEETLPPIGTDKNVIDFERRYLFNLFLGINFKQNVYI